MIGMINRDNLPTDTLDEFEHLIAKFRALWLVEHNEDGTHLITPRGFDFVPTGSIMAWSTDTAPDGWVLCRGQQLSRVDYKPLFDVIGTLYGAGDGATTFNTPDLQQRFPLGKAASGTGATLASSGGTIDHSHTFSGSTDAAGAHDHGGTTGSESSHTHGVSTITAINDLVNSFGAAAGAFAVSIVTHFHSLTGSTDAGSSHAHSISAESDHTHSISSGSTGTENPPFLTINYIILAGV